MTANNAAHQFTHITTQSNQA